MAMVTAAAAAPALTNSPGARSARGLWGRIFGAAPNPARPPGGNGSALK